MRCSTVRLRLPSAGDGLLPARYGRHLAACLACRAEAVRYRTLSRGLAELRTHTVPAPAGLGAAVMAGINRAAPVTPGRLPRGLRLVERGLVTVVGAGAAALGAWVVLRHRRSPAGAG